MTTIKLVLVRHGESQWNKENRFTGWCDIDLSENGINEAKAVGTLLKKKEFSFDYAFTSVLKRAIHTLWYILDELDQAWIPIEKSWKLNERHYGALQGLNKEDITEKYGDEQVKQWRRGFTAIPPKITKNDDRYSNQDPRYTALTENELPLTESLAMTVNRVVPYWKNNILPYLERGKRIIVVAHGNSIRALVKYLDNMNESEVFQLNVPTGTPIIYEFDKSFNPIKRYYLNKYC